MKKVLHKLLGALALILVMASCEDLTGLQGLPGENGIDGTNGANGIDGTDGENGEDAPLPPDIEAILSAALEIKTGGGGEPWAVKVSGLDLSDSYTARQIFHGVAAGIDEGDIDLDLSECSGAFYGYNAGIPTKDRARYTGLTLPNSLAHINDGKAANGAFVGFTGLKRISASGLIRAGDYAFLGCAALETLDLPQVTGIGEAAFAPNLITSGGYYYENNTVLAKVDLPKVETIGAFAFFRCTAVAELNLPEVVKIGEWAFAGYTTSAYNTVLERVVLPKVEVLDIAAFGYCPAISAIDLPNAGEIYGGAFMNDTVNPNTALKSVSLPETGIFGVGVFAYCTALESADLPVALSIGLFEGCTALTEVNAPYVTSIGTSGFAGCTALTEETLNVILSKVVSVGKYAFDGCVFQALELPSVTSFDYAPFRNCANLAALKLGPIVPEKEASDNGIFFGAGSAVTKITVQVPAAYQTDYSSKGWVDTAANGNATMWGTSHKEIAVEAY
jgi:hypothetical protein